MKILNATPPPVIIIPSNFPRTRRGPDSRGIRICVAQIGRSCSLDQGFVIFTDGSAYSYDPPSKDEFEALCASLQRGKQFNFQVRRARGGYVRGFTPPADYEVIYNFPPYAGSVPAACPVPPVPWPNLTWTTTASTADPAASILWTPGYAVSASQQLDFDANAVFTDSSASADGLATYNGPSAPGAVAFSCAGTSAVPSDSFTVSVIQDGTTIGFFHHGGSVNFTDPGAFTFADTMGADSAIEVQVSAGGVNNHPGDFYSLVLTAS